MIIVALASMLVASPFSAFAQQDPPIVNPPIVNLPIVASPIVRDQPPRPQTFGGRVEAAPPPPQQPKHAFYYRPGDLRGVRYDTIEECTRPGNGLAMSASACINSGPRGNSCGFKLACEFVG
jgi:hypothetical protein